MDALIKPLLSVQPRIPQDIGIHIIRMRPLRQTGPDIKYKADESSDRTGDRKYYQDSKNH
jgi:hypothetical protein